MILMVKAYAQKFLALSLGKGGAALVGVIVSIVMARVLSKDDVALYRQVLLAYTFFVPILELGVRQGLYYFLPVELHRKLGRIMDALLLLTLVGGVYALFILLGGNYLIASLFDNPRLINLSLWLIPMTIFAFPSAVQEPSLVSVGEVKLSAWISSTRQLAIGVCSIIALYLWMSPEAQFVSYVVTSSVSGVFTVFLVLRKFGLRQRLQTPSYAGVRELLVFSLPLGAATIVGVVNLQLDKILVGAMVEADKFAEYTFGSMEIPFIAIITGSVNAVMISDMRKYAEAGKVHKSLDLFRMAGVVSARFLFPITALFFVISDSLMVSLYGAQYIDSAIPFRVYLLLIPIRIVVFGALMVSLGEGKKIFTSSILSLLANLVLSIVMLHFLGMVGAAIATVLVVFLVTVPYNLRVILNKASCQITDIFDFTTLTKTFLLVFPPAVASYLLVQDNPFVNLASSTAIFVAYYAAIYHKLIFNQLSKMFTK
jgi:O-antigen/teichoic acid export membrane protein